MKRCFLAFVILCLLPIVAEAGNAKLEPGSSGKSVLALQQRLSDLGFPVGQIDGKYGKNTTAAVEEAQRLLVYGGYGVEITGEADELTLSLLAAPEAEDVLRTLCNGSQGERVVALQNRLIDLKLLSGAADGLYGSATENAVLSFQQQMNRIGVEGLTENGMATPSVVDLLMSDLHSYGFQAPVFFDESDPLSLTPNDLYAKSCILIDAPSGNVLFGHQADAQMYPASTTKIMTLLLALESQKDLNAEIIIPQSASDIAADSSLVPVYPGERMRMIDLLCGLMIRSGNDAANAVAELCDGSVESFVTHMNERAQELGLNGTHFANPHGYHDDNHYSTAQDLATLARLGMTNEAFCQITTCLHYEMPANDQREALVLDNPYAIFQADSPFFIPGAAGIKSGYTSAAGFCYVGAAQREGRTLIAVILGVPGRDRGWQDLRRLFAYGFAT